MDEQWKSMTLEAKLDWLREQVESLSHRLGEMDFSTFHSDVRRLSDRVNAVEAKLGQAYPED